MDEKRELKIGDVVIYYVDHYQVKHKALVTNAWSSVGNLPGCNVVYVSEDQTKEDPYGNWNVRRAASTCQCSRPVETPGSGRTRAEL